MTYKNVKIVGCEYSKYIQLLENRQGKLRRYRQENIKPLLTITEVAEDKRVAEAETLLKNSKYSYLKLIQVPNEDKWQILDTRKNTVIHKDTSQKVYENIKEITQNN